MSEYKIEEILSQDQVSFGKMIGRMSSQDLVRVVELIQSSMLEEQQNFAELSERLRTSEGSENTDTLKEELCLSQSRLAQLCTKNMKCFSKQKESWTVVGPHAGRGGTEQEVGASDKEEKAETVELQSPVRQTSRKSLSTIHREKKERENLENRENFEWRKAENSNEDSLRSAFRTVLGDILGQKYQLANTTFNEEKVERIKVLGQTHISTMEEENRSKLLDELKASVPKIPPAAGDPESSPPGSPRGTTSPVLRQQQPNIPVATMSTDEESLLKTKEKILEQVRRARKEGSLSPRQHPSPRSEEKPVKSILKKTPEIIGNGENRELADDLLNGAQKGCDNGAIRMVTQQTTVETRGLAATENIPQSKEPPAVQYSELGTVGPMPYKSPFRNAASRTESPAEKHYFFNVDSYGEVPEQSSESVPKLPDSRPPLEESRAVSFLPKEPEISADYGDIMGAKEKKFVMEQSGTVFAKPYDPGRYSAELTEASERKENRGPSEEEQEEGGGCGGDPVSSLPHALTRTRVQVTNLGEEKLVVEDNSLCRHWDPTLLLEQLYKIDYAARSESKRSRFVNMEGHLSHLPVGVKTAFLESSWKSHYFRTKEGRLLWFQQPFIDDSPLGDVLLAGSEIDVGREESILTVRGGRDGSHLVLRCSPQLLDKWRQALLSHAASSVADCYVQPIYPPVPHPTEQVAIIELGSCSIRAGVLTVEPSLPQVFFPTIASVLPAGEIVIGVDALKPEIRHRGTFVRPIRATQPAVNRYTMNLDVVKQILHKVFNDLGIDSRLYKVLLSVPQNCPTSLIVDLLKVFVEELEVNGVGVIRQPCLVLYSYDVTTGVVLDIGDRMNIVPIVDGYVVQNAIVSLPYGSSQISESLREKLSEQNIGLYAFVSVVERYILRYIMEEACRVAPEYEKEVEEYDQNPNDIDKVVSLSRFDPTPEMQKHFKVDSGQFTSTEGLMKPKKWGLDINGLHKLIYSAIQTSPMDSRRTLYRNIYLAGGCSLLPGIAERLENELSQLVAPSIHVQVHISPWRYHSAFIGAQIVASSIQFDQTLVTASNLESFIRKLYASNF